MGDARRLPRSSSKQSSDRREAAAVMGDPPPPELTLDDEQFAPSDDVGCTAGARGGKAERCWWARHLT